MSGPHRGLAVVPLGAGSGGSPVVIEVRALQDEERAWAGRFLAEETGSTRVVSRGRLHQADELPGFVALVDGRRAGLLTYTIVESELEVITLHSVLPGRGVGTALLAAAGDEAERSGCRRLWLITTNDNQPAIDFYRRRGMSLVAVHRNAVRLSRRLKPEIPLRGLGGAPIDDELEFELLLGPRHA